MKKVFTFLLALALLCAMTSTAFAAAPPLTYSSIPTEGSAADGTIGSASGMMTAMAADALGINIIVWRNSIQEISSGYLKLYGLTETDCIADTVETDFYLQQWNGTSWVTSSTSYNYAYDNDYMSMYIYRYVSHGYYYRLKTVHKGVLGTDTDSRTLYSSYIYVS